MSLQEAELNEVDVDKMSKDELWDEIGFHRPLGGFWYNLSFSLISMVFGIALSGLYFTYFYPFPESMGYRTAATAIFSLFFVAFDLGTHMTMDRFIAEARIKDPGKMIQYIQYFIWYQMITGLIQTTAVSMYALFIVPRGELAYAVWIMLIHSTTQYPGFLGVFRGVMNSLQQFNKTVVLNFVSGEIFQRLTEIIFIIWGRQWGAANPEIGEIMGIAIGATIGFYVDDFFATLMSAYFFNKVMRHEIGVSVRRCFSVEFAWDLVKETLTFGIKTGMPTLIGVGAELIMLLIWISEVPQYTTFITLFGLASGIAGIINMGMGINLTQLFSEAYMNGKKELTRYYSAQYIRFATMIQFFLLSIIGIILLIIEDIFIGLGLFSYLLAIPFILPKVVREIQQPFTSLADSIVLGTNRPNWLMFIRFAEEIIKVVSIYVLIVVLRLPDKYGLAAIIWIMPCGIYPAILFKTICSYIYINKKILKVKVIWWQTIGAPFFSAAIVFGIGFLLKTLVFTPLLEQVNIVVAIIVMISLILIILLVFYFPLTTLFGGWDDDSVREFKKSMMMSGPSKFLVKPMYKSVKWASKRTKLHNKFKMDSSLALKEARELIKLKNSHDLKEIFADD